jgi:hypothetical protein
MKTQRHKGTGDRSNRGTDIEIRLSISLSVPESSSIAPVLCAFVSLCLFLLLPGCLVGPNYRRPSINAPTDFRGAATQQQDSIADLPWWEIFKDETLKELVKVGPG